MALTIRLFLCFLRASPFPLCIQTYSARKSNITTVGRPDKGVHAPLHFRMLYRRMQTCRFCIPYCDVQLFASPGYAQKGKP
ncbi:hypothetical protein D3C77_435850 [compost metagenome]